jgi:hypothetical protein
MTGSATMPGSEAPPRVTATAVTKSAIATPAPIAAFFQISRLRARRGAESKAAAVTVSARRSVVSSSLAATLAPGTGGGCSDGALRRVVWRTRSMRFAVP